jgi:hypothetical protein
VYDELKAGGETPVCDKIEALYVNYLEKKAKKEASQQPRASANADETMDMQVDVRRVILLSEECHILTSTIGGQGESNGGRYCACGLQES